VIRKRATALDEERLRLEENLILKSTH
jgi:hypothetical protein